MIKPKIVTAFTHNPEWAIEQIDYKMPSVTVPDEAYTIEDLIKRHRAGLFTDVKTPIFLNDDSYTNEDTSLDDPDLEKLSREDIIDQREYIERTKSFDYKEHLMAHFGETKEKAPSGDKGETLEHV